MLDGPSVASALVDCGITHVIWIPDSEIGTWEAALVARNELSLLRVCREGEAFALAAGLWLGGTGDRPHRYTFAYLGHLTPPRPRRSGCGPGSRRR